MVALVVVVLVVMDLERLSRRRRVGDVEIGSWLLRWN
jgi:hypothetical protein